MRNPASSLTLDALKSKVGQELGVSPWRTVDQTMINAFAELTDDHQPIHINEEFARATPFGGTIAHGFLVLSLLSSMAIASVPMVEGAKMSVNYGFDRIRFMSPVRAGANIRGRFLLSALEPIGGAQVRMLCATTVEIENAPKPALVADWISMIWV